MQIRMFYDMKGNPKIWRNWGLVSTMLSLVPVTCREGVLGRQRRASEFLKRGSGAGTRELTDRKEPEWYILRS
jgi:hypothetical protein